jgi:prepilin-type N-terminal cleavage/methylation domain-containing protein
MKKIKGFTLIELLIVIALLGALAIGLLATIDPFEQLKKGRDTATRNTATEFYNANLRYYGTKGSFPWGTTPQDATTLETDTVSANIQDLIDAGELKTNFIDAAGSARLGNITLTSTTNTNGQVDNMIVCFDPESKNFALDPNTIYDDAGDNTGADACKGGTADGSSDDCYWCIL